MGLEPFVNLSLEPYQFNGSPYVRGIIHYGVKDPASGRSTFKGELQLSDVEYHKGPGSTAGQTAATILLAFAIAYAAHVTPVPIVSYPGIDYGDTPTQSDT